MTSLNIPEERLGVLVGKDGSIKRLIEKRTKSKLVVIETEVEISGEGEILASEIVKAIGRGFPPNRALRLLNEDFTLDVIKIEGGPNNVKRIMARVIGTQGKARKNLEKLTGASIAVYGKTVSLIGTFKEVADARKAVEMIILGRKHGTVYRLLEKVGH